MLSPDRRAGPRSVRTPTAAARGGAQRPADTHCCRRAAPDSVTAAPASWRYSAAARIWAAAHTGHSRRSGNPGTPASGNRCRCRFGRTVPVAQRQEPHRRLDRRQRVILTDVDVTVVNLHRQLPEPVIGHARRPLHPRRAKSGSPSDDNLLEPRCSAQHSPLPHRGPPGLSPFTVAPVNRTPAGLPEPRVGRIRRLQPSDLHPKSHYHPSARRAVRCRHSVVSSRTPVSVVPVPPRSRR